MTDPRARESRPGRGGSSDHSNTTTPTVLADALDDLADAMGWYEAGIVYGITLGRQQVVDEWHAVRADGGRVARTLAASPSYAEMCERRGQPERAAAARALLAERGITTEVSA